MDKDLPLLLRARPGCFFHAGVAQLARASAFQAEGRGFESRLPLWFLPFCNRWLVLLRYSINKQRIASDSRYTKIDGPRSSVGRALPW